MIDQICQTVLEKIKPTREEADRVNKLAQKLVLHINEEAKKAGVKAEAMVTGSIVRNTWLSGDKDLDIFILLPNNLTRAEFEKIGLDIAKKVAGKNWREAYAEHPYILADIEGYEVDLVPCYKISDPSKIKSAVDRTPFHLQFVKEKLTPELADEVRLFKQFCKGVQIYGSELKTQGISGYLAELLIIYYASFLNLLNAAAEWKQGLVIDLVKHYPVLDQARIPFENQPLIVVDPVDPKRNVAAALSYNNFLKLIFAAKSFLVNPSEKFFFPNEIKPFSKEQLLKELENRGTEFLFLVFSPPDVVPDILWPQLYKSLKSFETQLSKSNFLLHRKSVWSDEKELAIMVFEFEKAELPKVYRHIGPPVLAKKNEVDNFLKKYSTQKIAGPWVENGRFVVELERRFSTAEDFLKNILKEKTVKKLGLGRHIVASLLKEYKLLRNKEIVEIYNKNFEFAKFLTDYLSMKFPWKY
ncbi:MAG: CCA tRNA nucleotidyltransferase [Euryarchaeota archaeon]|nr:CCA tRNA nucleotidyltransferase [Euryarchaeota archaeon]